MSCPIIGVYKISNNISGKYYIGYSENIQKRFKEHIYTLEYNKHQNIILQRSFNKCGLENFTFDILHEFDTVNEAKEKELEYLQNIEIRPFLYNIHYNNSGGDTLTNHPDREKIIERISNTLKENYSKMTEQERKDKHGLCGEKNGMFGKTHTDEVKQLLRERIVSAATRKKLSENAKSRVQEKIQCMVKHYQMKLKKKFLKIIR